MMSLKEHDSAISALQQAFQQHAESQDILQHAHAKELHARALFDLDEWEEAQESCLTSLDQFSKLAVPRVI